MFDRDNINLTNMPYDVELYLFVLTLRRRYVQINNSCYNRQTCY